MERSDVHIFIKRIEARIAETKTAWITDPEIALNPSQVEIAISKLKELATQYAQEDMPVEVSLKVAELAALAIATHTRKVLEVCESQRVSNFDPYVSTILSNIGREIKIRACVQLVMSTAEELGFDPKSITLDEIESVFAGEPQYETAALKAFQHFQCFATFKKNLHENSKTG